MNAVLVVKFDADRINAINMRQATQLAKALVEVMWGVDPEDSRPMAILEELGVDAGMAEEGE